MFEKKSFLNLKNCVKFSVFENTRFLIYFYLKKRGINCSFILSVSYRFQQFDFESIQVDGVAFCFHMSKLPFGFCNRVLDFFPLNNFVHRSVKIRTGIFRFSS